ncbi:hypothetical protein Drose_08940 [Dactylosporangium roseum]|uniref:Uncharacterized protein n=1 Tax=Dactylosporangium roseum TaxID=47989 RepID=A0ABY5Z8J7_9ACTN|nr:PQQ-binding-like beta-propeller repeat protein [Dactylosporangium roseum]UWZ38351.1 hypothetical protein Drose_08940 [Dactylosporangium roseum]
MPVSTVTIDLGVVDDGWAAEVDARPAGLPRGWGLLAAAALVLSLASAVPLPEPPHEVTRQPLRNGQFHLTGGALFVLESDRTPTPVEAFDAADGSTRWTYTPDGLSTLSFVTTDGDLAVLSPDLCRSGVTGTTFAVDLRTGWERWHATGVPVRTPPGVAGTVVLRSLWSDGCGALAANTPIAGTLRWQAIDGAGRTLWEVPVEPGTRVAVDTAEQGAAWAALLDKQGGMSIVDFATGARSSPVPGVFAGDLFAVAGDLLIVAGWDASGTVLTAYGRDFRRRWESHVPTGPASGRTDRLTVRPCAGALCVTGQRTAVLDSATGVLLWTASGRPPLTAVPGGLLAAPAVGRVALLDPATGLAATELRGWDVLGIDGARMLLGLQSPDGTLLAWSAGPEVTPFATVEGRLVGCELDAALVACRTAADEVLLLRLPVA